MKKEKNEKKVRWMEEGRKETGGKRKVNGQSEEGMKKEGGSEELRNLREETRRFMEV